MSDPPGEVILLLKKAQNSYFGNITLGIEMVMIIEAVVF